MEETNLLIAKSQAGDKEARKILIENNLGLVHHIVKRFAHRGYDLEDLFQIGSIGLIKAIDKFDLNFDVKFSTYAVPMIMGEIKRFLRDDGMIKVSRTVKENGMKVKNAIQIMTVQKGRDPYLSEIVEYTGLSEEEINLSLNASAEVESLYKTYAQSDGSEIYLVDRMAGNSNSQEKLINHMMLEQTFAELEERDKKLIILRYFQNKTQSEVARLLGISQVQVSRMEKKILLKMRNMIS